MNRSQPYDAIIVGGGLTGLGAAYRLGRGNKRVLLLERSQSLGGLASCYAFDKFSIERYYHHAFFDDEALFQTIRELGLEDEVTSCPASTGYLVDGKIYGLDTPVDLLRFRPLGIWGIIRLGLLVLKIKSIRDEEAYDEVPLKPWVIKHAGERVYETFFAPLLRAKFGRLAEEISAAWFIARIKLRSNRGVKGEKLVYMRSSFQRLHDALAREVNKMVEVRCGVEVEGIELEEGRVSGVRVGEELEQASAVISTVAPRILRGLVPGASQEFLEGLHRVAYQGTICMTLALRKSLTSIYWLNIGDKEIPFGLLLEHNNLYDNPAYGHRLVYLASYVQDSGEPLWQLTDKELLERYVDGLGKLFGVTGADVEWWRVSRTLYSAPLYRTGFLRDRLPVKSMVPGLYTAGMFNSYPERSINDSLRLGFEAANLVMGKEEAE